MSKRISPAQRLQAEIDGVFAGGEDLAVCDGGAGRGARVPGCCCEGRDRGRGDRVPGSRPLRTRR